MKQHLKVKQSRNQKSSWTYQIASCEGIRMKKLESSKNILNAKVLYLKFICSL